MTGRSLLLGAAVLGAGLITSVGVALSRRRRLPAVQLRSLLQGATAKNYRPVPAEQGAPQGKLSVNPDEYPKVKRGSVVEVLHGTRVEDPYRWLEDPDSKETQQFVEQQNALTDRVLARCPSRDAFRELFTQLYDYERYSVPFRKGSRYYYTHNTGLQAQSVLFTQGSVRGEATVLIDPNTLSDDGTVALMGWSFSEDGSLMAYSLSSGGSDWRTVHVTRIDAATGARADLPDVLEHVKFSGLAWSHDGLGFFYNRYKPPATADAGTETGAARDQQLCYHVLRRPQAEDATVLAIPEHPEWMMGAEVTHDGRYLIMSVSSGCEPTNRLWYVDLEELPRDAAGALDFSAYDFHKGSEPLPLVKLVDEFEAQFEYVGGEGGVWTLQTNLAAPRYRLVRVDVSSGDPGPPAAWPDLLPQHDRDLLQWAAPLKGGQLATCYLRDVASALQLRRGADGGLLRELALPGIGSVAGFSGSHRHTEFFFSFVGFTEPGAQYRCDVADAEPTPVLFRRIQTKGFSPDDFVTEQVFVESKDGTRVPMFVVHKRGLERNGRNPTLLYGYGGFNISLEPGFSVARLCWLLAFGGVAAVANLRGGGEYGTQWRDAGSKQHKQNVFDDFQACAQYLHTARYSSPETLAIQGGSNGGLLVMACAEQRPDLFVAVLAQVGVMDMLRFHKFTIGAAWTTDYGDPDKREEFEWVLPYSPLHNVAVPAGGTRQYPAVLLTTGDHDDRVVPLHSHKLIATLQHVLAGRRDAAQRNPLLTRVEVRAGHGAGKPTQKVIAEVSDMYSFAAAAMGAAWVAPTRS